MDYYRFGRVLVPEGGMFEDVDSALEFTHEVEQESLLEQIQDLGFTTDEEGILHVLINNKRYNITLSALKDLCKLLKVPASYINKFPGRDLVLENLNNNPYLKENTDTVKLAIWAHEEHPVITGVLPGADGGPSFTEYLEMLQDSEVFDRENVELDQIAITGEEMVLYFFLPEELNHERFSFNLGYAMHYSATTAADFVIYPFCKMTVVANSGEPFDFDFESSTKLHIAKRKKEDFLSELMDVAPSYVGQDLGAYYEEVVKYGTVSRNLDEVKYAILKYLKSKAVSTYNYGGMKIDGNEVAQEVIPEYKEFYQANQEQLKTEATYSTNNLPVGFYLPAYFNRFFTFPSNIENPAFMIRYRKAIGACLNKMLDEVGDVVVDTQPE